MSWHIGTNWTENYTVLNGQALLAYGYQGSCRGGGAGCGSRAVENFNDAISSFKVSGC